MSLPSTERAVACPICGEALSRIPSIIDHSATHIIRLENPSSGYIWRCGCGKYDGMWEQKIPAIASLSLHMQEQHLIEI
jgi:hypothetical protein